MKVEIFETCYDGKRVLIDGQRIDESEFKTQLLKKFIDELQDDNVILELYDLIIPHVKGSQFVKESFDHCEQCNTNKYSVEYEIKKDERTETAGV